MVSKMKERTFRTFILDGIVFQEGEDILIENEKFKWKHRAFGHGYWRWTRGKDSYGTGIDIVPPSSDDGLWWVTIPPEFRSQPNHRMEIDEVLPLVREILPHVRCTMIQLRYGNIFTGRMVSEEDFKERFGYLGYVEYRI